MLVQAIHSGRKFNLRDIPSRLGMTVAHKDPLIIKYGKKSYLVLLKYGVVIFWGFTEGEKNRIASHLVEFLTEPFEHPFEETIEVEIREGTTKIDETGLHIKKLTTANIAVVSLILGRSVALDHYDREVEKVLNGFESIMQSFAQKGQPNASSREMLKKVGFAMSVQHAIVVNMALLDKPDLTWEDATIDRFYLDLSDHYEIEERFTILNQKLTMIMTNVQFIVDFLNTRRSTWLEIMIVILFVVDIALIVLEGLA